TVKAMFMTKVKIAAAVLAVGGILAAGGGVLKNSHVRGQQGAAADSSEEAIRRASEKPLAAVETNAVAKTGPEKLRGTWNVVEFKMAGEDLLVKDSKWFIGKNKIVPSPTYFI